MNIFKKIINNKNYPFHIDGLKTYDSAYDYIICNIDTSIAPNINSIDKLFSDLPQDIEIFFYDNFHPTFSDPGAYVTARKNGDKYIYYLGNHGWSSSKYWTTKDYLVNYLFKNWNFNKDTLRISKAFSKINKENIENEKLWDSQLTEVLNKNWTYKLYEVNGNHLLSVVCGTVGIFDINIFLDSREYLEYKEKGEDIIDKLAEKIRCSPDDYRSKNITIRQSKK